VALSLVAVVVAAITLLPVVYLLVREGVEPDRLRDLLASPTTIPLLINTLALVVGVTFACVVLGLVLAVLTTCTDLPGRRGWMVLFTLPLCMPSFVTSYTWVAAGYRYAPTSTVLYGLQGAVLVLTLSLFPFVFLPVVVALRGLDASHDDVARALGYGRMHAFFRVTLPQLRWAVSGGALLIALHMLAEFGALQLLRYQTLTTAIMLRATSLGSPEQARSLAVVLTLCAFVVLAADFWLLRRTTSPERVARGAARRRAVWRLGAATPAALLVAALVVLLALGVPLSGMIPGIVELFTGQTTVDREVLRAAAWTSARYGFLAAALITLAALPISILAVRFPGPLPFAVERATWVAHALPGVIVALAMIFVSARLIEPLYQTTTLLIVGYTILYLPIAVGAQQSGIRHADRRFDEVARSLGRGPFVTFFTVTLPLALPSIAAGAMLAMLSVSKELTMTLLLRPTGANTLATSLWATTRGEVLDFSAAAPYALGLIVVSAIPTIFLVRALLTDVRPLPESTRQPPASFLLEQRA
jgi:iron(III) transport system permease protein